MPNITVPGIILLLVIAMAIGGVSNSDHDADSRRQWIPTDAKLVFELSDDDRDDVYWFYPYDARFTTGGDIYVLDGGGYFVRRFESDGSLIHTYGSQGDGPGEIRRPNDFFVTDDGLYILDVGKHRVIDFDTQSHALRSEIETSDGHGRMTVTADGRIIVLDRMHRGAGRQMLSHLTDQGAGPLAPVRVHEYQDDLTKQIALDGFMHPTPDGGVVLAFHWWGTFVRFDKNGEVVFNVPTLVETPMARIREVRAFGGVGHQVDPQAPCVSLDVSIADGSIYILSAEGAGFEERHSDIVDRYSLADGSYSGSFRLPRPVRSFDVLGDRIVGVAAYESPPVIYVWAFK